MTGLPPGAWNARLRSAFELGADVLVNLPAPQAENSQPLGSHPLGALLEILSPSAARLQGHSDPCALIAFAGQSCVWLRTPTIWARLAPDTTGQQWLAWGAQMRPLRQRCQAAGWNRIAWLVGISFSPELTKVACYSLVGESPQTRSEWLVSATDIHPL